MQQRIGLHFGLVLVQLVCFVGPVSFFMYCFLFDDQIVSHAHSLLAMGLLAGGHVFVAALSIHVLLPRGKWNAQAFAFLLFTVSGDALLAKWIATLVARVKSDVYVESDLAAFIALFIFIVEAGEETTHLVKGAREAAWSRRQQLLHVLACIVMLGCCMFNIFGPLRVDLASELLVAIAVSLVHVAGHWPLGSGEIVAYVTATLLYIVVIVLNFEGKNALADAIEQVTDVILLSLITSADLYAEIWLLMSDHEKKLEPESRPLIQ